MIDWPLQRRRVQAPVRQHRRVLRRRQQRRRCRVRVQSSGDLVPQLVGLVGLSDPALAHEPHLKPAKVDLEDRSANGG
jgi:hypothetical protein